MEEKTVEQRVKHLEVVVERLVKRSLGSKAFIKMPPMLISGHCYEPDSEGFIARGFIPVKGKVIRLCIGIGEMPEEGSVVLQVFLQDQRKSDRLTIEMSKNFFLENVDYPIEAGTAIILKAKPREDGQFNFKNIWYSVLYSMQEKIYSTEKLLISELENSENAGI